MGGVGPSDAELLSRVASHDAEALRVLHARHAPWILARLRSRCVDGDVVFEALQDTFVAVWRSADAWSGTGEPAAWLWGIAARRLIGVQRHRARWAPVSSWRDEADLSDEVGAVAQRLQLDEAVSNLSPELCDVVRLTYVEGLSVAETGDVLAIPAGTVKTRLMRARKRLRGVLE